MGRALRLYARALSDRPARHRHGHGQRGGAGRRAAGALASGGGGGAGLWRCGRRIRRAAAAGGAGHAVHPDRDPRPRHFLSGNRDGTVTAILRRPVADFINALAHWKSCIILAASGPLRMLRQARADATCGRKGQSGCQAPTWLIRLPRAARGRGNFAALCHFRCERGIIHAETRISSRWSGDGPCRLRRLELGNRLRAG